MNFDLTESQRLVRDLVREFAEREVRPRAAEIDRTDEFPGDLYKRMAELEILGMTLPPEYGARAPTRCRGASPRRSWPAPRRPSRTRSCSAS